MKFLLPSVLSCSLSMVVVGQNQVPEPLPPKLVGSAPVPETELATQVSEYIRRIFQDKAGNLWFGTNGDGACRYDGKSLRYFTVKDGLSGMAIRGIQQAADGTLWFGTDGGVSRFDGTRFTTYTEKDGLGDNGIWSLLLDKAGNLWAGTTKGVYRFDGKSFQHFPIPSAGVEHPNARFTPQIGLVHDGGPRRQNLVWHRW
jgi:ligand-binding sensor domain-containing protein